MSKINKFVIVGCVDNGEPNAEVFYSSDNEEEAKEVYQKLLRLNDLQFPTTKELKEEFEALYKELQDKGIELFSKDSYIEDTPVEFDLTGIFRLKEMVV